MRKGILTLLALSVLGCATIQDYRGTTLEGFPLTAEFSNNCNSGRIQIGPFRGITIVGEDDNDEDGILDSIVISHPEGYPVRTTSKKAYESDIPEEHPLSKYANRDVLQKLYDEMKLLNF